MANLDVERKPQSGEHRFEFVSIQDYYDNVNYGGAVSREIPARYRRLARRFQPWPGKKLLDIASGVGLWLWPAADLRAIPAGISVIARWKDLHVLSLSRIAHGPWYPRPLRVAQALALTVWPLSWQYQVYHLCVRK